jgi:hypothetical protein
MSKIDQAATSERGHIRVMASESKMLTREEFASRFMPPDDDLQGSPPGEPLSEPFDVFLFDRTTESLEQENRWLKERVARIKRAKPSSG